MVIDYPKSIVRNLRNIQQCNYLDVRDLALTLVNKSYVEEVIYDT